jgi:cytochrome b involved in lipid metabolism
LWSSHPYSPAKAAPTKEEKAAEAALPTFTLEQVQEHTTEDDCWIILHGKVYDATTWLKKHPGGVTSILGNAGKDSSKSFDVIHSDEARDMLPKYLVGILSGEKAKL